MNLTGIEIGFGNGSAVLLFPCWTPDTNHDDKPDGEPIVKLDG
ncbi:MAG: hypothetical protein U0894_03775 [Pirellulales bacterium]